MSTRPDENKTIKRFTRLKFIIKIVYSNKKELATLMFSCVVLISLFKEGQGSQKTNFNYRVEPRK